MISKEYSFTRAQVEKLFDQVKHNPDHGSRQAQIALIFDIEGQDEIDKSEIRRWERVVEAFDSPDDYFKSISTDATIVHTAAHP